jgi:hypothetical protein
LGWTPNPTSKCQQVGRVGKYCRSKLYSRSGGVLLNPLSSQLPREALTVATSSCQLVLLLLPPTHPYKSCTSFAPFCFPPTHPYKAGSRGVGEPGGHFAPVLFVARERVVLLVSWAWVAIPLARPLFLRWYSIILYLFTQSFMGVECLFIRCRRLEQVDRTPATPWTRARRDRRRARTDPSASRNQSFPHFSIDSFLPLPMPCLIRVLAKRLN